MSLFRSARIRAQEAAAIAGDCPSRSAVDDPDGLWCCCGGVDDGHLMLCCDKQCEGCCVWYHFDCLGLSYPDAVLIGASQDDFVCPHCSGYNMTNGEQCASETTSGPAPVYAPYTDFQWGDVHGQLVCNFMLSAYEKVVHWKPNVFLISFGKAGKRFVKGPSLHCPVSSVCDATFTSALHLRYGWKLLNIPSRCVCGVPFSADHAMICRHGGLTFVRHNALRNITAEWLSKTCHGVALEPPL